LRISFEVTKTIDSTANAAKIEVYNLSQEPRTFAELDGVGVLLSVGYSGFNQNPVARGIFKGDILRIQHVKNGGDIVTTIESGDKIKAIANTNINVSFTSGTPIKRLIDVAAKEMGVSIGELQGIESKQFLRGYSSSGRAADQLSLLADMVDADWSIQDGVLQFVKRDKSLSQKILVFTPETGLIGSPNKKVDENGVTKIQFTCLIQSQLRPGAKVRVTSKFVSGDYKVTSVTHRGDTRGGNWYSEVEAQ
jgi:hypothetical protein